MSPYCNCGRPECANPDPSVERELKKLTSPSLAIGDIVMLKSGGPPMTVCRLEEREGMPCAQGAWFLDDGTLQIAAFHTSVIRLIQVPNGPVPN